MYLGLAELPIADYTLYTKKRLTMSQQYNFMKRFIMNSITE